MLWRKCKKLPVNKFIHSFLVSNGSTGLKKFVARSCRAPNVHQTLIGGAQNIVHQLLAMKCPMSNYFV